MRSETEAHCTHTIAPTRKVTGKEGYIVLKLIIINGSVLLFCCGCALDIVRAPASECTTDTAASPSFLVTCRFLR